MESRVIYVTGIFPVLSDTFSRIIRELKFEVISAKLNEKNFIIYFQNNQNVQIKEVEFKDVPEPCIQRPEDSKTLEIIINFENSILKHAIMWNIGGDWEYSSCK